jgi:NADPH:quinone reductase-like Zn-dependent oxidoreductase
VKALVYEKYGSPDVLSLEEVPKPVPGDDDILVKISTLSINSWDWENLTGIPFEYRLFTGLLKPKINLLPGRDIAGIVEAVGKNVTQFKPGDEVFGDLADNSWGAFAEYVCVIENQIALKPAFISFEQAACLPHGGNLAVQGLIDYGNIKAGDKVLVNGGGGSTGTLAVQIAKLFDTQVTAVDSADKLDFMKSLGADNVIDYTKTDFTKTDAKYDLVFDVKTTRLFSDYRRSLNPGGIYTTVGGKTSRIIQVALLGKLSSKYNMFLVPYKANKDLNYILELVEAGKLKPIIDKIFPFEKSIDAFRYFGEGRFKGKVVITCNER